MKEEHNIAKTAPPILKAEHIPYLLAGFITLTFFSFMFMGGKDDTRPRLNILFVGNSYTAFYDMPKIVENLSKQDSSLPFRVYTELYNPKNQSSLLEKWNTGAIKQHLSERRWDYVVLQPQSLWATTEGRFFETQSAIKLWDSAIREAGAITVFFMTWPRREDSYWYRHPDYNITSAQDMYRNIYKATDVLERQFDMLVVPVADHWMYGQTRYKSLDLYHKDGSHPSQKGAFLNALLFYKTLINDDLEPITVRPSSIGQEHFSAIKELAKMDIPR